VVFSDIMSTRRSKQRRDAAANECGSGATQQRRAAGACRPQKHSGRSDAALAARVTRRRKANECGYKGDARARVVNACAHQPTKRCGERSKREKRDGATGAEKRKTVGHAARRARIYFFLDAFFFVELFLVDDFFVELFLDEGDFFVEGDFFDEELFFLDDEAGDFLDEDDFLLEGLFLVEGLFLDDDFLDEEDFLLAGDFFDDELFFDEDFLDEGDLAAEGEREREREGDFAAPAFLVAVDLRFLPATLLAAGLGEAAAPAFTTRKVLAWPAAVASTPDSTPFLSARAMTPFCTLAPLWLASIQAAMAWRDAPPRVCSSPIAFTICCR